MKKEDLISINNTRAKMINQFFLREKIDLSHLILLSEIYIRKNKNIKLPNISWIESELQVTFTKVKSLVESLERREFIFKIPDPDDKRGKLLDITDSGINFIIGIANALPLTK